MPSIRVVVDLHQVVAVPLIMLGFELGTHLVVFFEGDFSNESLLILFLLVLPRLEACYEDRLAFFFLNHIVLLLIKLLLHGLELIFLLFLVEDLVATQEVALLIRQVEVGFFERHNLCNSFTLFNLIQSIS